MRRAAVEKEWLKTLDPQSTGHVVPEPTAHYLRDVLRVTTGQIVEFFDGTGRYARARIQSTTPKSVEIAVVELGQSEQNESPCQITLLQAIPKGDRWAWVIEKATELGVTRLIPLKTSRSVVDIPSGKGESKLERWQKIAASAARQSQRSVIPELSAQQDLKAMLERNPEDDTLRFVLHVDETARSLVDHLQQALEPSPRAVELFIGPEGGFDDQEVEAMQRAGIIPCSLGPRVLRSETAGVVAIALVQSILGDLA